jgi:F-type H+-transporting ATPase subunit gamma
MEMVSAAKLRRTEEQLRAARPYYERSSGLLERMLAESEGGAEDAILRGGSGNRRLVIVATADRGLCGAFNANLINFARQFMSEESDLESVLFCIGKKGFDYFRKRGEEVLYKVTDLLGMLNFKRSQTITYKILELYLNMNLKEAYMVYSNPLSRMVQRPVVEKVLPLELSSMAVRAKGKGKSGARDFIERAYYIYEPGRADVWDVVLKRYLLSKFYVNLIKHFTAEHSARIMAMTNATQNCDELIESLTLELNKARQNTITKELLDIIGGAEALRV